MIAQRDAGIRWLNVHPEYLADSECWAVVDLARQWRSGLLPESGGIQQQAAWTQAAVDIVLNTWAKMQVAQTARLKET